MSLETQHTLDYGPAGPAVWTVLPLGPQMTDSLSPLGAFLVGHPLTGLSLVTHRMLQFHFFLCPSLLYFCLEHKSLKGLTRVLCNLFILHILYLPAHWNGISVKAEFLSVCEPFHILP